MYTQRKKLTIFFALAIVLSGCSKIDDYMLGKDNTPQPEALTPVEPKVAVVKEWTAPVSMSRASNEFAQLKPVIAKGIVYSADHGGYVTAVDKNNGKQEWIKKLSADLLSGPTISGDIAVFTTSDAHVMAVSLETGKTLWKSQLSSDALAKPVISGNKVIAKTLDGNLYAFDLHSGKNLWFADHGAPGLILKASSAPVIYGNSVLVGYSDGKLDAIELDNGRLLWQRSIAFANGASDVERLVDIDADPLVKGDTAYLGTYQGYVGALSLKDGQFKWRKQASIFKDMTLNGNALYYTDSDDIIWALNAETGKVNWKQTGLKARKLTAPVVIGKSLYAGDAMGYMHVLSTKDGSFTGRVAMGGAMKQSPLADSDSLYVLTANGKLSRLKAS